MNDVHPDDEAELTRLMFAHGTALGVASTSAAARPDVFEMIWRTIPTVKALVALANKHPGDFAAALERARAEPMPFTRKPLDTK